MDGMLRASQAILETRRLQYSRNAQLIANIKSAVSVFAFQIVRILRLRTSNVTNEVHIGDAMRIGVVGQDGEIVVEAMLTFEK
jgi:hypothetical protein